MAKTDPATPKGADIAPMSFEQALEELEQIVRRLEAGEGRLEESISAYERGAQLKAHCEAKLREAQAKVDRITRAADGTVATALAELD